MVRECSTVHHRSNSVLAVQILFSNFLINFGLDLRLFQHGIRAVGPGAYTSLRFHLICANLAG
jgi:hypothetical protein